jgi:hypothetical protein
MSVRYPSSPSLDALSGSQIVQLAGDYDAIFFGAYANNPDYSRYGRTVRSVCDTSLKRKRR